MIHFSKRWAALALAAALGLTPAGGAWAAPIITPLDQSQAASPDGSTGGPGAASQGPGGTAGPSASETTAAPSAPAAGSGESSAEASSQAQAALKEPVVAAQGAALLNATTGEFLYTKNGDTQYYPASITKLMTALLVAESCNLSDTVTFSAAATTNLESGAVSLNLVEGDQLTVEQCLYALLLKSANEVGNALAEHVAGSNAAFAERMNAKAAALGCTNTHFANPHGLNDPDHYTTAHDMALIAKAAFENETVRKVASTLSYSLPATKKNGARTLTMGHKMLNPSDSRYYPGIIGGKTGYTSKAGNTLVTAAEKDGTRLIAVILKSSSTHYTDTKALLDYGFEAAAQKKAQSSQSAPAAGGNLSAGPGAQIQSGWKQDQAGWYYVKSNGSKAASQWLTVDGEDYWFDGNGYMATGWRQLSGSWYYFHSNGPLGKNCWVEEAGRWFYVGSGGVMLTNAVTPDGYRVGADGAWIAG